jgi:hypothetical protein
MSFNRPFNSSNSSFRPDQGQINDQEYVVTQPIDDHLLDSEVHAILKAEYELLSQCDGLKDRFDSHAETCQVRTIPCS